jgi:hypothetical protein
MYLTEDITKFLNTQHHNKIMVLLSVKGKKLPIETVHQKLALTQAWCRAGKPSNKLEVLKEYLGDRWEAYTHPLVEKLYRFDLKEILISDIGKTLTEDHAPIITEILHVKLKDYIEYEGITSLVTDVAYPVTTKGHKIITFQLKSKYAPISIITITLDWLNFTYKARANFLDLGYQTSEISDESLKKVKKRMYEIADRGYNRSDIEKVIEDIHFGDVILDCLLKNIKDYIKSKN